MRFLFNLTFISILLFFNLSRAQAQSPAPAITTSHLLAAENFLVATGVNTQFELITDNVIAQYGNQIPADKKDAFNTVMKKFMSKYYTWDALKAPLSNIYATEFTEQELKQLTDFYNTPTGKKFGSKQAALMDKGMAMGQQVVMDHQTELQQMIGEAFK